MTGKKENCHYVTRSLTKPWEHETEHRGRELRFYSFETNKIEYDSSKKLLAKHKLLTEDQEDRFSDLIESPLGKFKANHYQTSYIDDYIIFRALFLYFMFQVERFNLVIEREGKGWSLSDLLEMDDAQLNTISEDMRKKFKVVAMEAVEGHILFFPEVGYYTFPILCSDSQSVVRALALPIYPTVALCLVPNGPSEDDLQKSRNIMMHFSVGLNDNYDKVIIPSEISKYTNEEIIKEIKDYRTKAVSHQKQCDDLDYLVRLMYASAGLNFDEVMKERNNREED